MPFVDPVCAEPKLFVGGLRFEVTREDVHQYFSKYGVVRTCVLLKHQDTGRSKGCAMILFDKWAHAEAAVEHEHGTENLAGDRKLIVKFADPSKRAEDGRVVGVVPKKLFVGQVLCGVQSEVDVFVECNAAVVLSSTRGVSAYGAVLSGLVTCNHSLSTPHRWIAVLP